ncbi:MAG TPA: hypothetical protein VNZ44_07720 [Pyrinomonadaceae bacterium]|nr:hypothetical protein [Pyrinomonadaceae bacterium]
MDEREQAEQTQSQPGIFARLRDEYARWDARMLKPKWTASH